MMKLICVSEGFEHAGKVGAKPFCYCLAPDMDFV